MANHHHHHTGEHVKAGTCCAVKDHAGHGKAVPEHHCGAHHGHANHEHAADKTASTSAIDPVCGMTVDSRTARHVSHEGQNYYFCSEGCVEKFTANPAAYLKPKAPAPAQASAEAQEVIYTCPMHPEVRKKGPGSCPICGMALEKRSE